MNYKFKKGDKVKLIEDADLDKLSIGVKLEGELLIIDDTPGREVWLCEEVDGQPTYTIEGGRLGWRIPESFLVGGP